MNNIRKYNRSFKYGHQKKEMTLDIIIDKYNEALENQSKTNFFFWYKISIPIVTAFNMIELLGVASFNFLNFLTGICGMIGAIFILYSVFKNNFSKTDLTKKLIIPSFVILFLSFSVIWDPLIDIIIALFPIFLIFFVIYYIKKRKIDDSVEVKSLKFFMTVSFKVLYIILNGCIIFILLFILLIPVAILKDKQLYEYMRIILMVLNFSNILYYFKLNFLTEFKNSISDIPQNDLFRLEKEAEIRQKKRYFLGMEFNKIYFSIFGFFIIPIIKNFLDYVKRKSNLSLKNSIANFFKEYSNIFSV